ncbi:MAG: type III pantothenate kinase, partial [bacterium]|nr:type III pantothenate kinase [bacterium]
MIDIGNTAIHTGLWSDTRVTHIHHLAHEDWAGLSTALSAARDAADDMELHAAAVATVVPELLGRVEE